MDAALAGVAAVSAGQVARQVVTSPEYQLAIRGERGERGVAGELGIQGPQGERGPQGDRGEKGDKGDPGRDGARGTDGADGKPGANGLPGRDGTNGLPGERGPDGADGVAGKTFRVCGEWKNSARYEALDVVEHEGSSYVATAASQGQEPPATGWQLLAAKGLDGKEGRPGASGQHFPWYTGLGGGGSGGANLAAGTGIAITIAEGVTTIALATALTASLSGGSVHEVGSSVASVGLSWSFSKTIDAQELTGTGTTPPLLADRAQTVTGPFTTDTTFTVTGHAGTDSAAGSTTAAFQYKRYWGVSASSSLNAAGVLALSGTELATARQQTRVLTPSAQYMYFAFPSSFGTPTFKSNGFNDTDWSKVTLASFVNASGATVSLDVWRSGNSVTGTFTEDVL